jgi:menaquinone-dependent protoporphyrinogen oxidase
MRILITCGSTRGGTDEIGRMLAARLQEEGHDVDMLPPAEAARATGFDAVIVGGALYSNRWHRAARRFVARRQDELRGVPVWFFSSGPLNDSADLDVIPPTRQVEVLMERVGAQGHMTFGGRLLPDARGFPASVMAKKRVGDWRTPDRIRAWATDIARALPTARPGLVTLQPGGSVAWVAVHGVVGWALCALTMGVVLRLTSLPVALVLHALAAPVIFTFVARHYFRARGARDPLITASAFLGMVALFDLVIVAGFVQRSLAMFGSVLGSWLPLGLIFGATWATGGLLEMLPRTKVTRTQTA